MNSRKVDRPLNLNKAMQVDIIGSEDILNMSLAPGREDLYLIRLCSMVLWRSDRR